MTTSGKGLKNYSTEIPSLKTIAEIEDILVKNGATDTWKQYENGTVTGLNFAVMTQFGKMPFRLVIKAEAVRQILQEQRSKHLIDISVKDANDLEYARRVAWRIIKDWIDSQMALVAIGMRKLEQVFLADIFDMNSGKTFFEILVEKKYAGLLMAPEGAKQ